MLIHDLDLAVRVRRGAAVADSSSTTWRPAGSKISEIADCTIRFAGGMLATLSASRVSQRKIRVLTIATEAS